MLLAGKVLLKRRVRHSIRVKQTQPHAQLMLFRQTASVVQPLQSQVALAHGWDMGVWRTWVSTSPRKNVANQDWPEMILMMLAVINNVMMVEFSRRHSARFVSVRQAQSMRTMASVATVFPMVPNALKMR